MSDRVARAGPARDAKRGARLATMVMEPVTRRAAWRLALAGALPWAIAGSAIASEHDSLQAAARLTAASLARELDRQWARLRALAAEVERGQAAQPVPELRRMMNAAQQAAPHTVWIGVASARDGKVIAASAGVLESADVSARPWFQAGLQRHFAGDVHSAALLVTALRRDPRDEPLRLIDFTTPVRNAAGQVVGVLGSHVDWRWVTAIIAGAPIPPGAQVALLSREGNVLFGAEGHWMTASPRPPLSLVQQAPEAPGLGWRLVGLPASTLRGRG
ncbi:hypothetical protein SAMN02745775_106132 [Falsiroseomonas stagni DSM 19981]|uniref:Cache domain-containing protein n=2 Tax=Falsiroseomonas TaxID=2870713 RepID=A0A1I4BUU7_9PROT|nr:hypothetical protein SAMN02745775_106132 [Falsiroseomonas stagni DSM 19981]